MDAMCVGVDGRDRPHSKPEARVRLEDASHRVGNLSGLQSGRGHLVQERLEGVMVGSVDHQHLNGGLSERASGFQARKSGPHDYHARPTGPVA